uniref:Uncharacterized protein n=1 Tax=Aegilops tauschii subsp. strangulata TaxID=200361 RepID=A0A453D295_AEGTS
HRPLHALLGGGAGTHSRTLANTSSALSDSVDLRDSLLTLPRRCLPSRRPAPLEAEEHLRGSRCGRHALLVPLRARRVQPRVGPLQRRPPPRRHPLLLGQVRLAAQQVRPCVYSPLCSAWRPACPAT